MISWRRTFGSIFTPILFALVWPYGNHPLSATFLLSSGLAVLALGSILFSLVLFATQFIGRHGVISTKGVFSSRIQWSIYSTFFSAVVLLALSHLAEGAEAPWRIDFRLRLYWYSLFHFEITNRISDAIAVFIVTHSVFSLIPLTRDIQSSMQSRQVLLSIANEIYCARSERQLRDVFVEYKDFLLAHARQDEVLHFVFGLETINNSLIRSIASNRLTANMREIHSTETQKLYEDALILRVTDAQIVRQLHYHHVELLKPLAKESVMFDAHLKSVINRIDGLLRRYQSGEIDNDTGIQALKSILRVDEVCLESGTYISLSNISIQLNRCMLSFIHNHNHRGIVAVYATMLGLMAFRLERDGKFVTKAMVTQFVEMVGLLADHQERPVLPNFRVAKMLPIIIHIHNMKKLPNWQVQKLSRSLMALKQEEVSAILSAYKLYLNQLNNPRSRRVLSNKIGDVTY